MIIDDRTIDEEEQSEHESEISFKIEAENENDEFVTKRNKKIPTVDIWSENTRAIQKKLNEAFPKGALIFWRINKSKFRVYPKTTDLREKLIEYLEKRGIHFNTYKPKEEKLINILIKNTDIDDEELIRSELNSIGIVPHTIKRYETGHMRKNNIESRIWHLLSEPNTDTKSLFEKKNIGAHIVKYEYMKKPTIIQCKRCQRFNHSASSCYLPYRCANQHEPGKCPLNEAKNKTKLKCANCGGAHTANNAKQCPAFSRAIKVSEERKRDNTTKKQTAHSRQQSNTHISMDTTTTANIAHKHTHQLAHQLTHTPTKQH